MKLYFFVVFRFRNTKLHLLISSVISIFMFSLVKAFIVPAICSGFIILFMFAIVLPATPMDSASLTLAPMALFWNWTPVTLLLAAYDLVFCLRSCTSCLARILQPSSLPSLASFLISCSYKGCIKDCIFTRFESLPISSPPFRALDGPFQDPFRLFSVTCRFLSVPL